MIPVYQTKESIDGVQCGNSWEASVASILECKIEDFPSYDKCENTNWVAYNNEVITIIANKGYLYSEKVFKNYSPERNKIIYEELKKYSINGYVLATGESPNSTFNFFLHSVVWDCENQKVAFDPHKSNLGIKYPMWYGVFIKV